MDPKARNSGLVVLSFAFVIAMAPLLTAQTPDPPPGAIFEFTQEGQLVRYMTDPHLSDNLGVITVIPQHAAAQGFTPGNILVSQYYPHQVLELTPNGSFIRIFPWGWGANGFHFRPDGRLMLTWGAGYDGVAMFWNNGASSTQFAYLCCCSGIDEDSAGNVYVTSNGGGGTYIAKFSSGGAWQTYFGYYPCCGGGYGGLVRGPADTLFSPFWPDSNHGVVREFSTGGTLLREIGGDVLLAPGVAVTPAGDIFAPENKRTEDYADDVIFHFAPNGSLVKTISHPRMGALRGITVTPSGTLLVAARLLPEAEPEEFYDPFDSSTLDPAWQVLVLPPGVGSYSLTENPGYLRVRDGGSGGCITLVRPFSGDNWTFETKAKYYLGPWGGGRALWMFITFGTPSPFSPFEAPDFVEFDRHVDRWGGGQAGEVRQFFYENGVANPQSGYQIPPNGSDTYVLRVRRDGRTLTYELSDDGTNVRFSSSFTYGPQVDSVPQYLFIGTSSYMNYDSYADYDYVRLTKGTTPPNQPPIANAGADQTVECTGNGCAAVTLNGSASSDPDNDPLTYEWKEGENVVGTTGIVNLPAVSLGPHAYTLTVNDGKGGTATDDVAITVQDTTPPVLTLAHDSTTVLLPSAGASGASVDVLAASGASASDQCDPNPTLKPSGSAEYPPGSMIVQITASDHSGHSVSKPFTVKVVYNFAGFLQPINSDGTSIFKAGRTIPVKFRLTAADGSIVSNAVATLEVAKVSDQVIGIFEEAEASGASNLDNYFRFDPTAGQYIYNLSTVGFSAGTYVLRATLNDGTTHDVYISVR